MGRKPKRKRVFNEENKRRYFDFLISTNKVGETTLDSYWYRFADIADFEEIAKMDMYLFSKEDWKKAFKFLVDKNSNYISSPTKLTPFISTIQGYIDWAKKESGSTSELIDISAISRITGVWNKSYEDKVKKIISRDEMYRIVYELRNNWQDVFPIVLLYEGVSRNEIKNLKIMDCDFENNTLVLSDDTYSTRIITIPKRSMDVIKLAAQEDVYIRGHNNSLSKYNIAGIRKTDYLLRFSGSRKDYTSDKVDSILISPRVSRIAEIYKFKFSTDDIVFSGIIDFLLQAESVSNKDLSTEDDIYKIVSRKFRGSDSSAWNRDKSIYLSYKSYLNIDRKFLDSLANEESIKIVNEMLKHYSSKRPKKKADANSQNSSFDLDVLGIDLQTTEGRESLLLHVKKERDLNFIKKCKKALLKKNGELRCEICKFSFQEKYGKIGIGYIEAHHTKPISELTSETIISINDIIFVCSNCHRIIHRRYPCYTKHELIEIIENI